MDEVIEMSQEDIKRHHVIRTVLERRLPQSKAACLLDLSIRQIRRLCRQVRLDGARGLVHGLRGRPSNNRQDPELLEQVLSALHDPLWDGFGPVFAHESLQKYHGLKLGKESVRKLMLLTGLWQVERKGWRHRSWRARRPCLGMLVQLDGSLHDWFEGRAPKCVFIAFVDDATSDLLYGEFAEAEATLALLAAAGSYFRRHGLPVALYVDKGGVYKVNNGDYEGQTEPITQFTRAMGELGVEVIHAHSPQAKGRVERCFGTHQDRLVKELRLAGISSIPEANRFVLDRYIPEHNRRFGVAAAKPEDAHRPLLPSHRLERILAVRHQRTIFNDYTLRYGPGFLQLLESQPVRVGPGDKVEVEERLDGSRHIRFKDVYLQFKQIPKRPYRPYLKARPSAGKIYDDPRLKGMGNVRPKDHPWKRLFLNGPYRVALAKSQVAAI